MKVSEMLGIEEKIEKCVEKALDKRSLNLHDLKEEVKVGAKSIAADVYSNMKSVEECKYKVIELETKLSNLTDFCKQKDKKGGC